MKMKLFKILSSCLVVAALFLASCEDYFEPSPNNEQDESLVFKQARFAEGILLNAYQGLPSGYSFEETASDDAVTNVLGRNYKRMATGEWSAQFNPVSSWSEAYARIFYLNYFLSVVDRVEWSWESTTRNDLFIQRFSGEAYALRAWYYLDLLRSHGGLGKDGNMLGFILLDTYVEPAALDPNLPRSSFDECVSFILADCNRAIERLPLDYEDSSDADRTLVFGAQNKNRVSGRHAMAIKSRLLLHAASPAFNLNNAAAKWEQAAEAAAGLLTEINGIAGLSATGLRWYLSENDPDIIWRRDWASILSWETQNFPPSLFGNGRDNPTQNFVDAFPMATGYPISATGSGYDENNPYTGRDPRLGHYVIYNGNRIGTNVINTNVENPTNGISNTLLSTVTGYYLKKLMNEAVRLTPGNTNPQTHFYTLFRYTEVFLNYAEAANEAWGPDADPRGYGFTPRQIIQAIRNRGEIAQPDEYLASVTSKDGMRNLIQNERRIELSFEGFRFWDIRRWNLNLSETARGMRIEGGVHTVIDVENRAYQPYMKYGPIPYREVLNNASLIQNEGW
jgi:starch-binding outer membrane protein, SusD/RagB family